MSFPPDTQTMKTISELYEAFRHSAGVSTDTRTIAPGSLFVALRGANFDANTMVGHALELGAAYVVTTDKSFANDPRAYVTDDTLTALQELARERRRHLAIPVIGITGTNGKTTTKELTTAVLSKKFKTVATKGNLNNHIGVPLTILSIPDDAEMAVVEMGASHPGEIAALVTISQPTAGLVTNVGIGHIEGFGSFEGVKRTKAELYDYLRRTGGTVFIDPDNKDLAQMLGEYANTVPYVQGCVEDGAAETLDMRWSAGGDWHHVTTHLLGKYNLPNALAAATVGHHFGVADSDVTEAIGQYEPTNGRSQIVQTSRNRLVVDAYNANPQSVTAALEILAKTDCAQRVAALGDMGELGDLTAQAHYNMGALAVMLGIDRVIAIGTHAAKIAEGVDCSGGEALHFATKEEALPTIRAQLTPQTAMLIKASHAMRFGQLVEALQASYD